MRSRRTKGKANVGTLRDLILGGIVAILGPIVLVLMQVTAGEALIAIQANLQRYIGGQDDGNGLYKLGARYYDPSQGRFTQMDPSGQEAHPYSYASCNPVSGKDPTSLDGCGPAGWILGGVSTIAGVTVFFIPGAGLAVGALGALSTATGAPGLLLSTFDVFGIGGCA